MADKETSFAARVLAAVAAIGGEVTTTQIYDHLGLQTRAREKRALNTLSDLVRAGRVIRVRTAVYTMPSGQAPLSKQEIMWRVFRARRRVTIADLQELAGVSHSYAKEWLQLLVRRGVAGKTTTGITRPRSWQLVRDLGPCPPRNDEKAARLRRLRRIKKDTDDISAALGRIRAAINDMENDDEQD